MAAPKLDIVPTEVVGQALEDLVDGFVCEAIQQLDELWIGVLERADDVATNRFLIVMDHREVDGTQNVNLVASLLERVADDSRDHRHGMGMLGNRFLGKGGRCMVSLDMGGRPIQDES